MGRTAASTTGSSLSTLCWKGTSIHQVPCLNVGGGAVRVRPRPPLPPGPSTLCGTLTGACSCGSYNRPSLTSFHVAALRHLVCSFIAGNLHGVEGLRGLRHARQTPTDRRFMGTSPFQPAIRPGSMSPDMGPKFIPTSQIAFTHPCLPTSSFNCSIDWDSCGLGERTHHFPGLMPTHGNSSPQPPGVQLVQYNNCNKHDTGPLKRNDEITTFHAGVLCLIQP